MYQMANMHEEMEQSDGSMGMLPGVEERFRFKTLFFPDNPDPTSLSGFTVNICASIMGMRMRLTYFHTN